MRETEGTKKERSIEEERGKKEGRQGMRGSGLTKRERRNEGE